MMEIIIMNRNCQKMFKKVCCGLKRRVLSDIDQPFTKIYEEELKKFVSACLFQL